MNFILKEGQTTRNQRHKLGPAKESTTRSHWFPNVPRIVVTPSAVPVRLWGGRHKQVYFKEATVDDSSEKTATSERVM